MASLSLKSVRRPSSLIRQHTLWKLMFTTYKKALVLFTLVATASLNGCVSVPMSSLENDEARKKFPPPSPGTAGLYVYRNTTFGGALKKNLYIDGELVAETGPMTYYYFEVQEGERKLSTESEFSPNDLILDVDEGNTYFVRQSMKVGAFVHGAKLVLVSEEEGTRGVLMCKLAKNIDGSVVAASEDLKSSRVSSLDSLDAGITSLDYYGQAEEEIYSATYDKNLWAKALVEAEGDETKRKARYIELRANQLYSEMAKSTPSPTPEARPGSDFDVSGAYRSELSENLYNTTKNANIEIRLTQRGDKVTGFFVGAGGYIDGKMDGNTMKFRARPPFGNWTVDGKWVFTDGYTKATGDAGFHVTRGYWNLTRIE